MPNIASLLKEEITRISRKEIRKEVQALRKAGANYRRDIASMKRAHESLVREMKQLSRKSTTHVSRSEEPSEKTKTRFVAKGFRSMRARLGLSANQLAKLLGVSMQSVYNWEREKAAPRANQTAAIAALRSIGKKEAHARLEAL